MSTKRTLNRRSFLKGTAALGLTLPVGALVQAQPKPPQPQPPPGKLAKIEPLPSYGEEWIEKLVAVGLRKQLLVDGYVISQTANVQREVAQLTKANGAKPLIVADKPWENEFIGSSLHVIRDEGKFRMWYGSYTGWLMCYAESADGLKWDKPELGVFDLTDPIGREIEKGTAQYYRDLPRKPLTFRGNKSNILGVSWGELAPQCCPLTVFRDPHETDKDHGYKGCGGPAAGKGRGPGLYHSPDGIRWTAYHKGESVVGDRAASDFISQALWDEDQKLYHLYTRYDFGDYGGHTEIRGLMHATNPDIQKSPTGWTLGRCWLFDREPVEYQRRQIMYFNSTIYEGIHLGLLSVHVWPVGSPAGGINTKNLDHKKRHERDVCDVYLATSRDGDTWDLTWVYANKTFLARGQDGSYDKDYLIPSPNIVTHNDKHWLYYAGGDERNFSYGRLNIGLATLRLDGFCFFEPWVKRDPAWIITKPFKLDGTKLEVNVDAKEGNMHVEVLDADTANPIPGYTRELASGAKGVDDLRHRPRWKDQPDLSALKGKTVRLKFHLTNAKLYAFQVRP